MMMTTDERPNASGYERFWPYFLSVHRHPWTRRLHAVATLIGLAFALIAFPYTLNTAWIIAGLTISYSIAWFSHWVFERKWPAAFSNPVWSFLADVDMIVLMARGRLDEEAERLQNLPGATLTLGRRIWHQLCQVVLITYAAGVAFLEWIDVTTFQLP